MERAEVATKLHIGSRLETTCLEFTERIPRYLCQ